MQTRSYILLMLGFLFAGLACEKTPVKVTKVDPVVEIYKLPSCVYSENPQPYSLMVRVKDPQGLDDIQQVQFYLKCEGDTILSGEMVDDGTARDVIARDGLYSAGIYGSQLGEENRSLQVTFVAIDYSSNYSEEVQDTLEVIVGQPQSFPLVEAISLPDTLDLAVTDIFSLTIEASDPDSDLVGVMWQLFPPTEVVAVFVDTLQIDNPTIAVKQWQFQREYPDTILPAISGDFFVRVQAFDQQQNWSHPVSRIFHVLVPILNDPPVLSDLVAPDSVSRSGEANFLLTVKVTDPQGLDDLDKVYFNSLKPDGSSSSGNPFYMRDDGLGDDLYANDGIYSLRVSISPQNQLGDYRFEFEAIDKLGAKSNKIIHIITVVE